MNRLSTATLGRIASASVPFYDRSPTPPIVHLGVGAFARAHLGVYADALLRQGWPAAIRGVSLRSRRSQDQLAPQDGLYSVVEREAGSVGAPQVIGSLTSITTGPAAAVQAIAAPTTRLVTLTITEKGYEPDPDARANSAEPRSAADVIALALQAHRRRGTTPPTVASLDNVAANGTLLRERVLEVAGHIDPDLRAWIAAEVSFPASVVDRMVPAATAGDLDEVSRRLGVWDAAAVVTERHLSWVLAAGSTGVWAPGVGSGLPPLADVGVKVVDDIAPFERRKLWLLNGPHSVVAYCGLLVGASSIAEAVCHPLARPFVRTVGDEILQVADLPAALDPSGFARDCLRRFANPSLGHTCLQVGADGSRKLPQRLLPVVAARRRRGLDTSRLALVVAAWTAAVGGIAVDGVILPGPDDPAVSSIRSAAERGGLRRTVAAALGAMGAASADDDIAFADEVARALEHLVREGPSVLGERS